jgi:hypothetical protein
MDVSWNSGSVRRPVALAADVYVAGWMQMWEGMVAFRRGETSQPSWSPAKLDGWNTAGMTAHSREMQRAWQDDYPGYVGSEYGDDWVGG